MVAADFLNACSVFATEEVCVCVCMHVCVSVCVCSGGSRRVSVVSTETPF